MKIKPRIRPHSTAVLLFFVLCSCENKAPVPDVTKATGIRSILDGGNAQQKTGWWPRTAVDSKGNIHLAYCDVTKGDVRYARRNDQGWSIETALHKGAVGKYIGLAVDKNDQPNILFYDQDQKILRFAWQNQPEDWGSEQIAWGLEIGMGGELVFDANNTAHAFYYITSGQLIHAKRVAPGQWEKKPLTDAIGSFTVRISVVLKDNVFWISYMDWDLRHSTLYLGKLDGQIFTREEVARRLSPGWRSHLFFVDGEPEIIFTQSVKSQIRWAKRTKKGWDSTLICDNSGNFAAAYQSRSETLFIAYEEYGSGFRDSNVRLLRHEKNHWSHYLIDSKGPAGTYLDLALKDNNDLVLAYYAEPIRGLRIYEEGIKK